MRSRSRVCFLCKSGWRVYLKTGMSSARRHLHSSEPLLPVASRAPELGLTFAGSALCRCVNVARALFCSWRPLTCMIALLLQVASGGIVTVGVSRLCVGHTPDIGWASHVFAITAWNNFASDNTAKIAIVRSNCLLTHQALGKSSEHRAAKLSRVDYAKRCDFEDCHQSSLEELSSVRVSLQLFLSPTMRET